MVAQEIIIFIRIAITISCLRGCIVYCADDNQMELQFRVEVTIWDTDRRGAERGEERVARGKGGEEAPNSQPHAPPHPILFPLSLFRLGGSQKYIFKGCNWYAL